MYDLFHNFYRDWGRLSNNNNSLFAKQTKTYFGYGKYIDKTNMIKHNENWTIRE